MKTTLEQNREDQALGAAWRRCVDLLDEDDGFILEVPIVLDVRQYRTISYGLGTGPENGPICATPTAALEALAEALEAR